MNERIRELAERADILFYQGRIPETGFEYEGAEVTVEDLKKFAELIVRECMNVASPNYMSTPEDSVYYVEEAIDRIAEHFGVE